MKAKIVNTMSAVWAAIICVMMGLTACQDYSIDSQPEGVPQVQSDALEQYNVRATAVDGVVFNVSANTPWKIAVTTNTEDQSWCVPSPGISSVAGLVSEVTVAVTDNESDTPREATLTITGDNVKEVIIVKIIQESKSALQVSGAATTEVFEVAGGTKELTIRANRAWEIVYANEQDREWLQFDQYSGEVDGMSTKTINATADENISVKRTATIIVKTESSAVEKVIIQDGATLEVSDEELAKLAELSATPDAVIEVPVTSNIGWEVETTETWIKDLKKVDDKFVFSCETNSNFASREGIITLKAVGGMAYTVPVTQKGAMFYCWGKSDKIETEFPEGRITDKGVLLRANDNFRIAFPGAYKHVRLTWEFEELSISSPLILMGANDYDASKTPNTHIILCNGGSGTTVNGGNDWRINGLGWYTYKSDILKKEYASIKMMELLFTTDGSSILTVKDKDDKVLISQTSTLNISEGAWGTNTFSYSLYFQATATDDSQYCILKSFKAESLD